MSFVVSSENTPRAVTAIGSLRVLYGILAIGYGLVLALSPGTYLTFMEESESDYTSTEELAFFAAFTGVIVGIPGVIGVVIGMAIRMGKKWAWMANVVFSAILMALLAWDVAEGYTASAYGIFFNGFILAYMFSKPVKAHFGRIGPPSTPLTTTTAAA